MDLMKNNVISWVFLYDSETIELDKNQKIIGTHYAPPENDEGDDYAVVLVIENIEDIPK